MNISGRCYRREARDFLDDPRLPGTLQISGRTGSQTGFGLDVSARGLGVILATAVEPGSEVCLMIGSRCISLVVRFCHRDKTYSEVFQCGLALKTGIDDLRNCFSERAGKSLSGAGFCGNKTIAVSS